MTAFCRAGRTRGCCTGTARQATSCWSSPQTRPPTSRRSGAPRSPRRHAGFSDCGILSTCCCHFCTCDEAALAHVWDRRRSEASMAGRVRALIAGEGNCRAAGGPAGPCAWMAHVCAQQGVLDALLSGHSSPAHACLASFSQASPAPSAKPLLQYSRADPSRLSALHRWKRHKGCCAVAQVYLYVSASKCVVGCVMLQAISSACLALPGEDGAASTADSCPLQLTSTPAHPACQLSMGTLPAGSQDRLHVDSQRSQGIFPVDWAPSRTQVHSVTCCSLR